MPQTELIHGDRRADRRYPFEMALRFSYTYRGQAYAGTGATVDLSSGGIRFLTETPPPAGIDIEVRVTWPFLLQNVCPMELVVHGKMVRSDPACCVVSMQRHEFRTCGARSFDAVDVLPAKYNVVG
jgi:hypothetical protein